MRMKEKEELGRDRENQSRRGRGAIDRQKRRRRRAPAKRSQGLKRKIRDRLETKGTNTEERVQGDHKRSSVEAQEPKGIEGGGSRVESQIKGANGPKSEAVETLPEANQRGESVVSRGVMGS